MESSLLVGKIAINFPDYSSKEFFIFEDLAELFNFETNYEAEKYIKKKLKENGTKKVSIDSESDFVSIQTKSHSLILDIAILINELANVSLDKETIRDLKNTLISVKPPKKQKWRLGDIFTIPIEDGTFYFGQIVELIEGTFPICVVFNLNKSVTPTLQELVSSEIIAAASISSFYLDDFTYKVIITTEPLFQIQEKIRRDPIRRTQYHDSIFIEFCTDYRKKSPKFYSITDNLQYVM
ncbi:Imm26 family immunity protein [Neobacillus sp. 179-J 1A1 HS]|uniref:Imm26 family immunity protein n=1 Tax=Neobacillus driksii TaxID=3035913 RepID=UPI0035BC50C7